MGPQECGCAIGSCSSLHGLSAGVRHFLSDQPPGLCSPVVGKLTRRPIGTALPVRPHNTIFYLLQLPASKGGFCVDVFMSPQPKCVINSLDTHQFSPQSQLKAQVAGFYPQ